MAALWQGVAVALTLALFLRLAPRVSAAHRFAAWAAGFTVVAGLPFLPLLAHRAAEEQIAVAAPLHAAVAKPWFQLDSRWGFAIAALWLAASVVRAAGLGLHALRLRKVWKTATAIQDAASPTLKVSARPIEICSTRHLDRPCVIGFLAPRILIPDWLLGRLTPAELEQVVLHEAEHLRRHDDWINLFEKLALVLFPLNPALAWMERRICREREMACDEAVVRRTKAPRAYAACLTSLAERRLQRGLEGRAEALSLAAWRRRSELVRRVHSILRGKQALHPLAARALVGAVGCGLLFASVELSRCPQTVAFIAAPQPRPVETAQLQPGSAPAAYEPQATSGFRAIPAKATLPASALEPASAGDAPVYHAPRRPQHVGSSEVASRDAASEPRPQSIEAAVPSATAARADQDSELQYFVLAAWVETRTLKSREIADYDTGAQAQTGASASPLDSRPATEITVMRLILAVYPVAAVQAQANSAQKPSSSQHVRPAAPPADGGWLVLQL